MFATTHLRQVEFTPATVLFEGAGLTGHLEVTDEVRETYFANTLESAPAREAARIAAADMPNGIVMVHSQTLDDTTVQINLASMDEDSVAGELSFAVQLTQPAPTQLMAKFSPMQVVVREEFAGRGHTQDLLSAACWLIQDIAASLFENATDDTALVLGVSCSAETPSNPDLAQAFAATLSVTSQAFCADQQRSHNEDFFMHIQQAA